MSSRRTTRWAGTGLPDRARGPFPARRLSGREGSWLPRGQNGERPLFSPRHPRKSLVRFRHDIGRDGRRRRPQPFQSVQNRDRGHSRERSSSSILPVHAPGSHCLCSIEARPTAGPLQRVKIRKPQCEHLFSRMPRIAARSELCWHLRSAPQAEVRDPAFPRLLI